MILVAAGALLLGLSWLLSWLFCGLARRIAPRIGLVDIPQGRKAHKAPTPLGGGLAIWLTVVVMTFAGWVVVGLMRGWLPEELAMHADGLHMRLPKLLLLLGLATAIMGIGLCDDLWKLSWKFRLGAQIGLAIIFVAFDNRVTLFSTFSSPWVGGAVTVLWIVGLTNSFNMLDNMDGLAAGVGLVAASLLAGAQIAVQGYFVPAALLMLAGALGGFWVHNRYPAKMFMGDAGSNFLGFYLGGLSVLGTFTRPAEGNSPWGVLAPLLVMAVPLYDTCSVVLIRIREGRSPFEGDRRHFSHRLVVKGLTAPQAVGTIYLVTLVSGCGALLLHRLDAFGATVVVTQTVCLLGVVAILEGDVIRPQSSAASLPKSNVPLSE